MAQSPPGFVPDGFEPDEQDNTPPGFVPDGFIPDEEEPSIQKSKGKWVTKGATTQWEAEKPVDITKRPDVNMIGGIPEIFDKARQRLVDAIAGLPISEGSKPHLARLGSLALEPARFIAETLSTPEGILFPGLFKGRVPPEVLPPTPKPRLMLPEGRGPGLETERYIAGEGGVQREGLVRGFPQEEARLTGNQIGPEGPVGFPSPGAAPHSTDLGEMRERERLANLFFGEHEQAGLQRMDVPDQPLMDTPVQAGDTRLGFESVSRGPLGYPLNIVPEAVRPRTMQSVIRTTAGEDFARQVIPDEPITFESPRALETPPVAPEVNMMGGTRAIEEGESILPSAPPKTRTAPHVQESERVAGTPYEDKVGNFVTRNVEPAIPGASAQVAPIIQQNKSIFRRLADALFVSGEKQMERMGPIGTEIRKVLSEVEYSKRELFNKFAGPFVDITKRLKGPEIENYVLSMDGSATPMNPNVASAVAESRKITDLMGQLAEQAGVRMKTPKGELVPFKPVAQYWPHRPVNPVARASFIDELMNNNPKLSRSQAERLARQFQNESEWFNSPQHSRMFGTFEWRKDLNSMTDHMADMADIISRAKILGPGDIGRKGTVISNLIERAPDPARASELVRTHLRGGMDKNNEFYQAVKAVNRIATKSQIFSKLGMFPISNLNNQLPTMLHGDLPAFASSVLKTITGSPTLKALAKDYGTASVGEIPVGILSEAGKKKVPIVGDMVKWSEDFARTIATGTGHGTAQSLFKAAKAGDKMSIRRLGDLLLQDDVSQVLSQERLTPEQLKFGTQRFVELAQQLESGMKLPPAWVNEPLLHIPLIFKRFSFQGTKSVKDAILSNPGRNIPLFLVASPLLGELTGDLKSLVYGVIRGAPEPEGMLDAIAFELAGRHKFVERMSGINSEESDLGLAANRLTADILQSWGLGLIADMLQGALGGKNAGYSALFGPAIDQALSIVTGIAGGDLTSLGREGLRSIPAIGPGLQRRLLPTQGQEIR